MKNPFEKLERKYEKMRRQRDEARAELLKLRTIQVTIETSAEYEVKEMHIDCEKKDFEVGKWYKCHIADAKTRFTKKGNYNAGYSHDIWIRDLGMVEYKYWQEMTPEEIKEVLTRRCKELGLFDGEFECLTGDTFYNHKGFIDYWEKSDKLWMGGNIAYEKGKFAKLVEKKTK